MKREDVELNQAVRFEIVKAEEEPLLVAFLVGLWRHMTFFGMHNVIKIALLDEEQSTRRKQFGKINQSSLQFIGGLDMRQGIA